MNRYSALIKYILPAIPVFIWCFYKKYGVEINRRSLIILVLLAPIWEEIVFRRIQEYLLEKNIKPVISNIITASIFSLTHLLNKGSWQALLTFFPAILIGDCFIKYRKVSFAIILHSIYNISILNFHIFP